MWRIAVAHLVHSSQSLQSLVLSQLRRLSAIAEPVRSRRTAATGPAVPMPQPLADAVANEHRQAAKRRISDSFAATDSDLPATQSARAPSSLGFAGQSPAMLARTRGSNQAAGYPSGAASKMPPAGSAPDSVASAESQPADCAATTSQHASQTVAATSSPLKGRQSQRSLAADVGPAKRQPQPQTVGNTAPGLEKAKAARGPSDNREAARHGAADAKASAEGTQPTGAGSAAVQTNAEASSGDSAQPRHAAGSRGSPMPRKWQRSVRPVVAALAVATLAASSLAMLSLAWRWRGPAGASSGLSISVALFCRAALV